MTPEALSRADRLARLAPATFLVLWASGFAVAKVGLEHAAPLTFLAWRYGIIVALLGPAMLALRPAGPVRRRDWMHLAAVGFLIQSVYFGLAYLGLSLGVSAGTAAVIASLQPLLVVAASPFVTGERITGRSAAGFALGTAGALLVVTGGRHFEAAIEAGIALCLASAVGMAAAVLYQKRFPVAVHPVTNNLVQYAVGFATILPLALFFDDNTVRWTAEFAFALGWLILANSIVAISLLIFMIARSEASRVSALFFLVPSVAALFGWMLLGETLSLAQWAGIALALLGIRLVTR